jgi:hypothetical protein
MGNDHSTRHSEEKGKSKLPTTREIAQALRQKGHHAFDLTSNLDESQVRAVFEGVGVNTADMDRETFWRMVRTVGEAMRDLARK